MPYEDLLGFTKFKVMKLPSKDPLIKLVPMIKLIGNSIVSSINKLTLALFELFLIPISNKKKKIKFIVVLNKNFFNSKNILNICGVTLIQIINQIFC